MFTRLVEMTANQGNRRSLPTPSMRKRTDPEKQHGFVDEIVLVSSAEPDRVLALSFWDKKEDAEEYQREKYQKIHDTLRHLLETEPTIRTFDVHTSIAHKVTAKQAA